MTVLMIGGRGQGKKELAIRMFGLQEEKIVDGALCTMEALDNAAAINGLHLLTRRLLQENKQITVLKPKLLGKVIICDELGCGVVPVERDLEDWREYTGRLCCDLAEEADAVIRVIAGMPQIIKGDL